MSTQTSTTSYDIDTVTATVLDATTLTSDVAADINTALREATLVAVDTETVYDQTLVDIPEHLVGGPSTLPRRSVVTDTDGNRKVAVGDLVYGTDRYGNNTVWARCLDVDGPGPWRVVSIAAVTDDTMRAWVIDVNNVNPTLLSRVFDRVTAWGWNTKFDAEVLTRDNVEGITWYDAMICDAVLRAGTGAGETSRYRSLAAAARSYLNYELDGKTTTRLSYTADGALSDEQTRYAAVDAIVTAAIATIIVARGNRHNLIDTFDREMAAKPLVDAFISNGLPIDAESYMQEKVYPAQQAAADAAQALAKATTGTELINSIADWATEHGHATSGQAADDTVERVLSDVDAFSAYCAHVKEQAAAQAEQVAVHAGGNVIEDDLFSDAAGPTIVAPFALDDDTAVRRWLSKQAPLFAQTINATMLLPQLDVTAVEQAAANDPATLATWAAGKKNITAAHDLDNDVLPRLARTTCGDVSDNLKSLAQALMAYRKYRRIVAEYSHLQPPVRLHPDWNIGSADDVKRMLNTYSRANVEEHFRNTEGKARLLTKTDSVDADTLKMIGGNLTAAILEYRRHEKLVTTYGETLMEHVHPKTGRIHATYKQAATGTGRLSSDKPNAQNFSPLVKAYMRPVNDNRVLVCGDLSQAELRFGADASGDINMLEAFASGQDLHERTAGLMFNIDMGLLYAISTGRIDAAAGELTDPHQQKVVSELTAAAGCDTPAQWVEPAKAMYKSLRHKAKRVAFGYAYGLGARRLAESLTIEGVPTTVDEAGELIAAFDAAYPQFAAWMAARVAYINNLAADMLNGTITDVDLDGSWKLHLLSKMVKDAKARLGVDADAASIVEHINNAGEHAVTVDDVTWAASYDTTYVLTSSGNPWMFESRTLGGRVRWFPITTSDWEWGMVNAIVRSRDPRVIKAADAWAQTRTQAEADDVAAARASGKRANAKPPVVLRASVNGRTKSLFGNALKKMFEDRTRRTDLVTTILAQLPDKAATLLRAGAYDRIKAAVNQFRNHPIQGGVADAMLVAMAQVHTALDSYPGSAPIQSVHDSLVIECDKQYAVDILHMLKDAMENGLATFCPNVTVKADADIQLSLDDKTKVDPDTLENAAANQAVA